MDYSHYRMSDWLSLQPLKFQLKEFRNDLCCSVYTRRKFIRVNKYAEELLSNTSARIDAIYLAISFETPTVIEMQIKSLKKNDPDPLYIVADNSSSSSGAKEIAEICDKYKVPYFKLPKNKAVFSRSHSYALQWSYENIIKILQPKRFGFLDHDVFLTKKLSPFTTMQEQNFIAYGNRRVSEWNFHPAWYLWAGFCFYEYDKVYDKNLYFMYDIGSGCDTGGRNYYRLYKNSEKEVGFCAMDCKQDFDLLADSWLHYRGASYLGLSEGKDDKILAHLGDD